MYHRLTRRQEKARPGEQLTLSLFLPPTGLGISKKGWWTMAEEIGILVKDKFCLTIEEASRYFGIGEKKLCRLAIRHSD